MKVRITLVGTRPLLMHNSRLADPLDPRTRALAVVTKKRAKTEADHEETAHLEWLGGIYYDDEANRVLFPAQNLFAALKKAGGLSKQGQKIVRGLTMLDDSYLVYDGPTSIAALWEQKFYLRTAVKNNGSSTVMRTRPLFTEWRAEIDADIAQDQLDLDEFRAILRVAGEQIGVGDWRPKYGRFDAEVAVI